MFRGLLHKLLRWSRHGKLIEKLLCTRSKRTSKKSVLTFRTQVLADFVFERFRCTLNSMEIWIRWPLLSHMHNRKREREICVAPEMTVVHLPTTACKMRAVVYADVYNKKPTERRSRKRQVPLLWNYRVVCVCVWVYVCVCVWVCLFLSLSSPLPRRDIGFDPSERERHRQRKRYSVVSMCEEEGEKEWGEIGANDSR